jgi:hypothetical protein
MTHLGFIAAAYALGVAIPGAFALAAFVRTRAARARLAAVNPRRRNR